MAGWIVWNATTHRLEVDSLFPSQAAADTAIVRLKKSRPPSTRQGPDTLTSKQVE